MKITQYVLHRLDHNGKVTYNLERAEGWVNPACPALIYGVKRRVVETVTWSSADPGDPLQLAEAIRAKYAQLGVTVS